MESDKPTEVTALLNEVAQGNEEAKNKLFAQVYKDLKKMAEKRMRVERRNHTWGASGLVNEVFIQLINAQQVYAKGRRYFFGAAATAMGQLLRDHARKRSCRPQGHLVPEGQVLLDEIVHEMETTFKVELLDLFEALDKLKSVGKYGERQHDVATLRIFGGLTYQDIADELGIGLATAQRDWSVAQAWLHLRLRGKESQ